MKRKEKTDEQLIDKGCGGKWKSMQEIFMRKRESEKKSKTRKIYKILQKRQIKIIRIFH